MLVPQTESISVNEIVDLFNHYRNKRKISYLKKALEWYLTMPFDEKLVEVLKACPDEFLNLLSDYTIDFLVQANDDETFDINGFMQFWLLNHKVFLGKDKFILYYSKVFSASKNHDLKNDIKLFLKVIYEDQINSRLNLNEYLTELIENYNSWLAYSMLGDVYYYDDKNYENAIRSYAKGTEILNDVIAIFSELNEDELVKMTLRSLNEERSYNIIQTINSHLLLKDYRKCIELCDEVLSQGELTYAELHEAETQMYKAFCLYDLKRYKEALNAINATLSIDGNNEQAIRFKLQLLEKLRMFNEKVAYINDLQSTNIKLFNIYSIQLDRLRNKETIITEDESFINEEPVQVVELKLSKRLLSGISHSGNEFTSEKLMEAFIVSFIDKDLPVFGRNFKVYHDSSVYGRQFRVKNGFVDLLLIEKDTNNLYVVELKKDKGYNNPLEQVKYYQSYVKRNIANKGQQVFSILCFKDCDEAVVQSIKNEKGIELYGYDFVFNRIA